MIVVNWCCMCKKSEETVDHLLLYCEIANVLRNFVLGLFGIECDDQGKTLTIFALSL
jgi:hypothetical protein